MLLCYILFSSSFPPTSFELFSRPNFAIFLKSPAFFGLDLEQDP